MAAPYFGMAAGICRTIGILSLLKSDLDLFSDHVYCFTKDGDVKNLRQDLQPLILPMPCTVPWEIKWWGARVNGNLVPIDYKIQNGDRVEIMTSQKFQRTSRDWLALVKTTGQK